MSERIKYKSGRANGLGKEKRSKLGQEVETEGGQNNGAGPSTTDTLGVIRFHLREKREGGKRGPECRCARGREETAGHECKYGCGERSKAGAGNSEAGGGEVPNSREV